MESYTKVCGRHEDFDKLDIEGRNPSKEEADAEKSLADHLLSIKAKTHEGDLGGVFSTKDGRWHCHICNIHFAVAEYAKGHLRTKWHMEKMAQPSHPAKLFTRIEKVEETDSQPANAEPDSSDMKEMPKEPELKMSKEPQLKIQKEPLLKTLLDNCESSPILGLEYVVQLHEDDKEPSYFCTLCLKYGDPRVILTHLTGLLHKSKFLTVNFPKVMSEIQKTYIGMKASRRAKVELVNFICNKIEEKHGRANLVIMEKQRFEREKQDVINDIANNHHHARESPSETYVELLTPEYISNLEAQLQVGMEGYSNVCGNHEDFDNLDIEGRIPSKDVADDEKLLTDQLLSIKVQTHEGNLGGVFSTTKRGLWQCHLCDTHFATAKHVKAHLGTKVHMDKMALSSHPEKLFYHIEKIQETAPQLAYGEPVPPGMEEEMSKEPLLKVLLDNYTSSPLIGLEYVVELLEDDKEPSYYCTLCLKCGDPRVILTHLAGLIHKSKYLAINFPKLTNEIQQTYVGMKATRRAKVELVNLIVSEIEKKHGRARLVVMEKQHFEREKHQIIRDITVNHPHLRESPSDRYIDLLTPEYIDKLDAQLEEKAAEAEQPTEETEKPGFKKSFHDTKIGCDRSKLRMRKDDDSDDDVMVIEQKRDGRKDKSPMTVSSISSDSISAEERRGLKPRGRGPIHSWRSRSRSPHRRSRSPYHHRRSPGPRYYKRSRSRSPYHRPGHLKSPPRRHRSRSPYRRSPNRHHRSKSRSFERYSRSPHRDSPGKHKNSKQAKRTDSEKARWEKFRQAVDHIEKLAATKLEYYEQHPEKHPEYTAEWKKFWTQRYKEVQAEGKDPERHDFKKEWAAFWTKRVRELQEDDITKKKEELKKQLGFVDKKPIPKPKPEERLPKKPFKKASPVPQQRPKAADKREHSAPKEKENPEEKLLDAPSDIVYSLRLLTALENLLGSLGPQVNSLLATALSLEKSAQGSSQSLLKDSSVVVLLETVSEKLKGLLLAGIVTDNLVAATRRCISCLSEVLKTVPPAAPDPIAQERALIASQIAAALVAQGKHDVTEEQLEVLINTVISMAKSQKQEANKSVDSMEAIKAVVEPSFHGAKSSDGVVSGLQLLQSAYNESKHSPKIKATTSSNADNLEDLTEEDLRVLLRNFKQLSSEEQQGLIDLLKKMEMTNPQKVERLRKYVVVDSEPKPSLSSRLNRKPSPLSLRAGGFNNPPRAETQKKLDSDSDDDYNYTDILLAASKNVKESEQKKKLAERKELDAAASLRETKEKVASMLGSLPLKLVTPQQKPAVPQQPAPVTQSTASPVPVVQQQPRYSYPAENTRQSYSNVQPPAQKIAAITNVTSYSGHQQITAPSATHSVDYASQQQHSYSNSSYAGGYGMQQQQQQTLQQQQPPLQQPHQQLQRHQQPQHQQLQQQWTDQNYINSNPYNSQQNLPYSQYTQSYSRQQYY